MLLACAGAFGSQRLVMRGEAPAVPAPRQMPGESAAAPSWTRAPTPVAAAQDFRRLPPLARPADINPFDPTLAPSAVSRVAPLQPEDVRPQPPRTVQAAARDPRAERRRARARALAAERARAARQARRAPAAAVATSAALGVSPHYDLMR